jgi:hypothetical protein
MNGLGWRLRQNEELSELLDVPVILKYIMFKRLQWARPIVQMDNNENTNNKKVEWVV